MYEELRGKRLLIIGSDDADVEIVRTAKEMGIYTICADGKPCSINTPAKNMADEAWDIDYSHTTELAEMAKAAHIDGVLSGYSEFRALAATRVAGILGFPAYTTEEILNITRHKRRFKEACRKYGVPVPDYVSFDRMPTREEMENIPLPCIVKPVDSAGKKGVNICNSREQLLPALESAFGASVQKEVIVEEFLSGTEFMVRIIVIDGIPIICSVKDKFHLEDDPSVRVGNFILYSSTLPKQISQDVYPRLNTFLRGLGIEFGVVSFQGIRTGDKYNFFECNFRIGGGNDQKMMEYEHGFNYIKMMIEHALTGKTETRPEQLPTGFSHICAQYRIILKPGTVGKMEYPKVGEVEHLVDELVLKEVGVTVTEEKTSARRGLFCFLSADTMEQIKEAVRAIDSRLDIRDTEGNSMLYTPFRTERLDAF